MSAPSAKYVIDTHGLKAAFESSINFVISGLSDNDIEIFRKCGNDFRDAYPDLNQLLKNLPGRRKYLHLGPEHEASAALLIDKYGSTLLSNKPPTEIFYHLTLAKAMNYTILSSGKALKEYRKVIKKCGLPSGLVQEV